MTVNSLFRLCVLGVLIGASCLGTVSTPVRAQEWVNLLFKEKEHDFGTVPRNAKAEHRFVVKNPFEEDIQFAQPMSSCSCSTPKLETLTLKPHEEGAVLVHFNSDLVKGSQKATITVPILKPYPASTTLQVRGYVRNDVVFNPPSVNFGDVPLGKEVEKEIKVTYYGRNSLWNVREIVTDNSNMKLELGKTSPQPGRIEVSFKAKLLGSAPAGDLSDRIFLQTSDSTANRVPIMVEGEVTLPLRVKPEAIYLGTVPSGTSISRAVVVSGDEPFLVKDLSSKSEAVRVTLKSDPPTTPAVRHVLLVEMTPLEVTEAKSVKEPVKIETDQSELVTNFSVIAVVKPKE